MKIPIVTQCKYLGVIVSERNSDNNLKRQMRKFYANAGMLIRNFFNSKLKIAYNNNLRRLLGLPKYNSASEMFVNLNILSFGELLRKFVFCFKTRISVSHN